MMHDISGCCEFAPILPTAFADGAAGDSLIQLS